MDFVPLASGSKANVKALYKRKRSAMNVASSGLLGVAVGYSEWADWEMAGWKLLVGCCSGLQWVGGPGDGWLETAGRVLQWVTVGGRTGRWLAGNCL